MKFSVRAVCASVVLLSVSIRLTAEPLDAVVVTATRFPESADRIPADITLVSGQEASARGAKDMASVLSLVAGVEAPPGGDAGPSSAVPSFWGLHEFDAFLLVVDGVPWGGAFNPGITTLDFTNTQRVEVLKGAAPVMYGATSFVGVVHVIHHPAGEADDVADLAYGTYGSLRGSVSAVLPELGNYRQSIAIDGERLGFADSREAVVDEHALYRGALTVGAGTLTIDANLSFVRDAPPSPVLRTGTGLTAVTPLNANFNPADAAINENKFQLALGYSLPTAWGNWETKASFAYSTVTDRRAFLHPDLSGTADTQNQSRYIEDGYLDTHLAAQPKDNIDVVVGADLLIGLGRQTTLNGNGDYTVPLDGSVLPPPISSLPVNEIGTLNDKRIFAGQYALVDWKPDGKWDLMAGVRLNEAYEHKNSSDLDLTAPPIDAETDHRTDVRPTVTLGASYRLWADGKDQLVAYADFRDAFKPAAIDFGPDFTPDILKPETAKSYEGGLKGAAAGGLFSYQLELFWLDFKDLVVATDSGALANAAGERLKGIEAETRFQLTHDLAFMASASYHDARFSQYLFFDGTDNVNVGGRQLTLSPHVLAAAGLLYTPDRGFSATAVARYVGRRFLDEENTAAVGGYTTLDATLGYRFDRFDVTLQGFNLTNQRPPVTSSEFGSESFYLLPARMLWVRAAYHWR